MLAVIAGYDKRDPFSVNGPQPDFIGATKSFRKMKIAWSPTLGFGRVDPEVARLTANAVADIERLGFAVELIEDVMDDPIDIWTAEFYAGVGTRLRSIIDTQPDLLDPAVLDVLRLAIGQDMKSYYASVFELPAYDFTRTRDLDRVNAGAFVTARD